MEPRAGSLYTDDRSKFDQIAKEWTWRYAMIDTMEPTPSQDEILLVGYYLFLLLLRNRSTAYSLLIAIYT